MGDLIQQIVVTAVVASGCCWFWEAYFGRRASEEVGRYDPPSHKH